MMKMALSFAITVFGLLESGDAGFLPRLANDPNYVCFFEFRVHNPFEENPFDFH